MRTITISDESAKFLEQFAGQLKSQDNRGTQSPYYFTVRCVRELAAPDGHSDEYQYYDRRIAESYTEEDLRKYCEENEKDFDSYVDENCTKYCLQEVEFNENVFFTEAGYEAHIRLNGHNYRHHKRHFSYVEHAHRNPEVKALLDAAKEIGEALSL